MEARSEIAFADEKLKESFYKLKEGKFEEKQLYKWLNKAFDELKQNIFSGIQVPKGWRLMYSIGKEGLIIISIIPEWMDHKNYEKRFNY